MPQVHALSELAVINVNQHCPILRIDEAAHFAQRLAEIIHAMKHSKTRSLSLRPA